MIVKLNMRTASKIVSKICLTAIVDTFYPVCGLRSREGLGETGRKGGRLNILLGGDIHFGYEVRDSSLSLSGRS